MADHYFLAALLSFPPFGARSLKRLRDHFSSYEAIFRAPGDALIAGGAPPKTVAVFLQIRRSLDPMHVMSELEEKHVSFIPFDDTRYPRLLKEIYDPPAALYVLGELPNPDQPSCAIVGSRSATPYGRQVANAFSRTLAESGLVIVSGLASGIDTCAHEATLETDGVTVAVLASGVDRVGTAEQRHVSERILDAGGAIISEFPLGAAPTKFNFPIRNRIISGMSLATLVVEAAERSGSLLTARSALEQGREVFAVPGPVTSDASSGTNQLIKTGAHVATRPEDILDVLNLSGLAIAVPHTPQTADTREEALLLPLLSKTPVHADALIRGSGLSAAQTNSVLTLMEMKGKVRHVGGRNYIMT